MQITLSVLNVAAGVGFFYSLVRAMRFAKRNEDRLESVAARASWWIRMLGKNGYGEDLEAERKRLAIQALIAAGLFFASATILYLTATRPS